MGIGGSEIFFFAFFFFSEGEELKSHAGVKCVLCVVWDGCGVEGGLTLLPRVDQGAEVLLWRSDKFISLFWKIEWV